MTSHNKNLGFQRLQDQKFFILGQNLKLYPQTGAENFSSPTIWNLKKTRNTRPTLKIIPYKKQKNYFQVILAGLWHANVVTIAIGIWLVSLRLAVVVLVLDFTGLTLKSLPMNNG